MRCGPSPPRRRPYPFHYDRWEVIARLHDDGPAPAVILELLSPDQFVNAALDENPYSHPVRNSVEVEGLQRITVVRPGEEAILFLVHNLALGDEPERYEYALDGVTVSPAHAVLLRAAIAARRPPPAPGLFARWWAMFKG